MEPKDLDRVARNELKTLTADNADWVAKHLVMAASLIDDDPIAAHQHALSAARRAGRIGVVRETLAITAYETGDYALALRELRTYRRITGSNAQLPLMVDSERGVGRPERALELGRSVDRAELPVPVRVALSIAMSGARLDLGQPELALVELEIPELDPDRAFEWSPALFAAYAEVLDELGRSDEAAAWRARSEIARAAIEERDSVDETIVVVEEPVEPSLVKPVDVQPFSNVAPEDGADVAHESAESDQPLMDVQDADVETSDSTAAQTPDEQAPDEQAPDEQAPDEQAPDEQAPDEQAPDEQADAADSVDGDDLHSNEDEGNTGGTTRAD